MGYLIKPEEMSEETKDKMREQAINASLKRTAQEGFVNGKKPPTWKDYRKQEEDSLAFLKEMGIGMVILLFVFIICLFTIGTN